MCAERTIDGPERFLTIVADPPWDHSDGTNAGISTLGYGKTRRLNPEGTLNPELPYPVMSLEQIAALPVADLAANDAHLYLWTTNRYLRDAFDIVDAWGFRFSSCQVWCKAPIPLPVGGAFRSNVEYFLFARRGSLPHQEQVEGRWFTWPRRRGAPVALGQRRADFHSAKPEAFLDLVERVSPGPYLELFARRNRLGWHTWGNQSLNHVEMGA